MAVPEPDLKAAAQNVFSDVNAFWITGSLRARTLQLCNFVIGPGPSGNFPGGVFPPSTTNNRPVADWISVLAAFATATSEPFPERMLFTDFSEICNDLYRLLWMAYYLQTVGGISNAQAQDLLDAFNISYTP